MLSTNGGAYINGPLVTTGNVEIQGEIVGYVGINTATAHYPLEVHDFGSAPIQDYAYYALAHNSSFQPTENIGGAQSGADVSIYASNRVLASEFNAFSDARIKNIKGISNTTKDLATINALEITDYTLKDKIKNGNKSFKKVIAQQVEKVYPEVVSKHVDFIPNVYQLTNKIEKISNGYLLSFKNNHSISDTAKKLQLLLQDGKSMKQFEIVSIPSSNSVIIKATDLKADKIFVYGEEVNDFRTVDYEGLTTLNISATQELSKLVKAQQTAMEAQDKKIEMLVKEIELLKGKNLTAFQAKQ